MASADDAGNLDKWTFPDLPQSMLDPGEYRVVFTSGQDVEDYVDPDGNLHTDFKLGSGGEYLALTDPNDTIIHEYAPEFPPQISDVSYGVAQNVAFVGATNSATALVPTDGSLGTSWTEVGFDDSAWLISGGGVGVGFDAGDDDPPDIPNGTLLPGGLLGFDLTDPKEDGTPSGTISSGGSSPGGEEPPKALDNTTGTKWLAFEPTGTFYQFRFSGGQQHAVNAYTITSANDVPNRDPYSWTLSGSNDGVDFSVVDTRTAQNFASRFETRLYGFGNNSAYNYYRFDFLTEFGAIGSNEPDSIQMAEIELLSTGPVNYDTLIDLDVETEWTAAQTSVYERIEFDVPDPSALSSLVLRMQYDDGFVAYLNGQQIAAADTPSFPTYNSNATAERDDAETLVPEEFIVTQFLDLLVAGANVLAIHGLNVDDASPDLLLVPELIATTLIDDTLVESYFVAPTPGSANELAGATLGPVVRNVTENPPQPTPVQDLVVIADVTETAAPIDDVTLVYRVMFGSEVSVSMNDNGTGADVTPGDGVFTAAIPSTAYSAGQMVRWYVTAADTSGADSRFPLFVAPTNSPEYFGTAVLNADVSSALPVFEYFVEDTSAASTRSGTRASVFFLGEFCDNVFIPHSAHLGPLIFIFPLPEIACFVACSLLPFLA